MSRVLMIFEIPGKQGYIFGSKALQHNVERSLNIAYLMNEYADRDFFRDLARERDPDGSAGFYDPERNLVYAGGGHTILQFERETLAEARETARSFGRVVTWEAMRRFHGIEMFTKIMDYDETLSPGENVRLLHWELERKKARRQAAFRRTTVGMERLGAQMPGEGRRDLSFRPVPTVTYSDGAPPERKRERFPFGIRPPEGFSFPLAFEDLADSGGFIAVVHIDGNGMGNRSAALNARKDAGEWEAFRSLRQRFTESVKTGYRAAFLYTMETARRHATAEERSRDREGNLLLPLRPVILAGDDVCFVTAGEIGLSCAKTFLEFLANRVSGAVDRQSFPACAGVVLVHKNYPFHRAYALSEELCGRAKEFAAQLDGGRGAVSAMDWHIEFGQLRDNLDAQREDYRTEDGNRLELRPVTVSVPGDLDLDEGLKPRSWAFFRAMCETMQGEGTARSKIKGLRNALKQGEVETRYFLRMNQAEGLLDHSLAALYATEEEKAALYRKIFQGETPARLPAFAETDGALPPSGDGGGKRSLLFDSIEMIDHCRFFEEG